MQLQRIIKGEIFPETERTPEPAEKSASFQDG